MTERLPGARLVDPEYVGYLLTTFTGSPTGDFQDLPLWRHLVIETVAGLDEHHPGTWVAPMSLINPAYRTEILGGIRAAGADLREFILTLPEDILRARIDADQLDVKANGWRHRHVTQALTTFTSLPDATFVDATQPPDQVADAIAHHARQSPAP